MLVAELEGRRVEARDAVKGPTYICPNPDCKSVVILRKTDRITPNFAHKSEACLWGVSETEAHRVAKIFVADALNNRGLRAEVEHFVPNLDGDRRADVMVFAPDGRRIAIELQHSSLPIEELETRATSYSSQGIAQVWIPFIPATVWKHAELKGGNAWRYSRYSPRPFERALHQLSSEVGGYWMYDPPTQKFWQASLMPLMLYQTESTFWEGGSEQSYGGYGYLSSRFRQLTLFGPYNFSSLRLKRVARPEQLYDGLKWPGGHIAVMVADDSTQQASDD